MVNTGAITIVKCECGQRLFDLDRGRDLKPHGAIIIKCPRCRSRVLINVRTEKITRICTEQIAARVRI